jgi:hypothetical protein
MCLQGDQTEEKQLILELFLVLQITEASQWQ